MGKRDEGSQPKADPRSGKNPGYAEDQPQDRRDARQHTKHKPAPTPDEPGLRRDPDPPADPAGRH
jgi:hypothetical protein